MKLPDFLEFEPFNRLRNQMKASLVDYIVEPVIPPDSDSKKISKAESEKMEGKGLDIDINQVEVLDDGTLKYKDRRILIYIRDINSYGGEFNMPRFHFANCGKYREMKQNGRGDRYVASIKTDGFFDLIKISSYDKIPINEKLLVCKLCLTHIHYNQYPRNKQEVFNNFSLKEYFEQYPTDFLTKPKYDSITAPINQYSLDWNHISRGKKEQDNYTCQKCRVKVTKEYSKYFQVHHANGLKFDNADENLESLCYKCHAEEPYHGHMKNDTYYEFLKIYDTFAKEKIF